MKKVLKIYTFNKNSFNNYLTKLSHAHAFNLFCDDDKAISNSMVEQTTKNKINQHENKINQYEHKVYNEWLTSHSNSHAFLTFQDDDKAILESLNEQIKFK